MKLQKFTCVAVLSALVLGAVTSTAFAAEEARSLSGKGTVKYKINDESENEGNETTDPENPDKEIDVPEVEGENNNDKKGELRVDYVSHLKFDDQKITTSKGLYFAKATNGTVDGQAVKRGNFIKVTDQRGDGTPKGWTLSAELTKQFTNGTVSLDGATISYMAPFVNSSQKEANHPQANVSVTIDQETGSQQMAYADEGKGWGAYTIEYGRPSLDLNGEVVEDGTGEVKATMEDSIVLEVPANTPLDTTKAYEAEITWTIANL